MTEPSEEVKAMARRCAAKYWQTGVEEDETTARRILSGEWDDQAYTQAALAAILETQRRDDAALTPTSGEEMRLREAWISDAVDTACDGENGKTNGFDWEARWQRSKVRAALTKGAE